MLNKLKIITTANRREIRAEVDIVSLGNDEGHAATRLELNGLKGVDEEGFGVYAYFVNPENSDEENEGFEGLTVAYDGIDFLNYDLFRDPTIKTLKEAQIKLDSFITDFEAKPYKYKGICTN